jgi:hypothetical protein
MYTLYDLLGGHPDDDADRLKKIYRDAIRASHPDVNPGDPQAHLRVQQILGAYAILGDARKRAAYDRLINIKFSRLSAASRRTILTQAAGKIASDVIAVGVVAGVLLGGYAVFRHVSDPPNRVATAAEQPKTPAVVVAPTNGDSRPRAGDAQAISVQARQAGQPAHPADGIAAIAEAAPPSAPAPSRTIAPALAFAPEVPTGALTRTKATPNPTALDHARCGMAENGRPPNRRSRRAEFLRQKALASFRAGDAAKALADLDRAIRLDPGCREAHVDRTIVLYRMKKSDRPPAAIGSAKPVARPSPARPAAQSRPLSLTAGRN